ncbi:hypothetical protein BX600DRAFT_436484 [Xylariales sp. PMI_506]|nr:hypothetical protein BX600DRAFT_436484 [Xylariales sp. PMI_506]
MVLALPIAAFTISEIFCLTEWATRHPCHVPTSSAVGTTTKTFTEKHTVYPTITVTPIPSTQTRTVTVIESNAPNSQQLTDTLAYSNGYTAITTGQPTTSTMPVSSLFTPISISNSGVDIEPSTTTSIALSSSLTLSSTASPTTSSTTTELSTTSDSEATPTLSILISTVDTSTSSVIPTTFSTTTILSTSSSISSSTSSTGISSLDGNTSSGIPVTITVTVDTSSTTTGTTTTSDTTTISVPSSSTPLPSGSQVATYVNCQKRAVPTGAGVTLQNGVLEGPEDKAIYKQEVQCLGEVIPIVVLAATVTANITRTVTVRPSIITETTTTTITCTDALTPSIPLTVISTVTSTSTVQAVLTIQAPAATHYAACDSENMVTSVLGFGIGGFGGSDKGDIVSITSSDDAYSCCALCFQTPGCVSGGWDESTAQCLLDLGTGSCHAHENRFGIIHAKEGDLGLSIFNGPCGEIEVVHLH